MWTLAIAIAAGVLAGAAAFFVVGPWGAILPLLGVTALVYVLGMRTVNKQLTAGMMAVQNELRARRIDQAITMLEALKAKFGKKAFFTGAQIDGQIGSIHFMKKDFEKARPYLERAFVRMWDAKTMLAVLLAKKKENLPAVDAMMDKVARYSPKQGLMWSVWAYLHWKAGENARALQILARGKEILGETDQVLAQNVLALQNGKKMKMKGYGEAWYQFHLEEHPMVMEARRGGNVRFARR
jgi:predicted Zn-dependent protease